MGGYIIKGDEGFQSIPVNDAGYPIDYSRADMIPIDVEFGTQDNKKRIWQSGQAYIDAYYYVDTQGYGHYSIQWYPLSGWSAPPTPPYNNEIGNIPTLYIGAIYSDAGLGDKAGYMAWNKDASIPNPYGVLFNGSFDAMGAVEDREWDEEPTDDPSGNPDNMGAIGGQYADTDSFDTTDFITTEEIHPPEEMDYGKLISAIVLHEDQQHGYNLTQLNDALFLPNFWTSLKNRFEGLSDPLSMIISTIELPFTPYTAGTKIMKLGGITVTDAEDNPILVRILGNHYTEHILGSLVLKEVWGTEKDYNNCSVEIYLPYVGVRTIDTDLAVNYALTLHILIDNWTGDILYLMRASNRNMTYKYMDSEFVAYRWSGNCAKTVPLGKVDNTSAIMSLLGMPAKTIGGAMTGGALGAAVATGSGIFSTDLSPIVQSSGSLSGNVGRMDLKYPYLIIKRGVPIYPNDWRAHIGATRYQTFTVGDLHGFTKFSDYHADQIEGANDAERAAIEQAMKAGVFLP